MRACKKIVRRGGRQGTVEMNQEEPYILPLGFHWLELLTKKHLSTVGGIEWRDGTQGMV